MAESVPISLTNALHNVIPILELVNSLKSSERTLHQIIEQMVKDFNCTTCAIIVKNPDTEILEIKNFYGLSWNFCKTYQKRIESALIRDLIWKNDPIYVNDSSFNPVVSNELKLERDFGSCYAIPVSYNQKPAGYLYLDSTEVDNFSGERQLLAQVYAHLIGITLFRDELSEELNRLMFKDEDSGAIKYNHFFYRLQEIFQQAERLQNPFSILLLDIEGYSNIVRTHGTDISNQLLSDLVSCIQNSLRKYDGLSRYGTDEFLIALPGTRLHEAKKAGEKIQRAIAGQTFSEKELIINAFFGVSNYPENCSSLDGLITAVKNALLEAKRSNKVNTVVTLKEIAD